MTKEERVRYWLESAEDDWKVANHLFEKGDYPLETITDFNLEARYPDERFSFKRKCTREFTETYLHKIEEIRRWLLQKIQP